MPRVARASEGRTLTGTKNYSSFFYCKYDEIEKLFVTLQP